MLIALGIDTITVTGDISFHPDPRGLWIAPAEYDYPDGQPFCEVNDKESCLALEDCVWVVDPRGSPPSGEPPNYCEIAAPPQASPPPRPETIRVRLDGINITSPTAVFVILTRYNIYGPLEAIVDGGELAPGQDVAELPTTIRFFNPGRVDVSVCLNTTPCPSWDEECSACRSERLMINWLDGESGGPSNLTALPPSAWLTTPFRGEPSLWEDKVERVSATFRVMAPDARWWMQCQLQGMDDENAGIVDLCRKRGSLTPDACQHMDPTGMDDQEVRLVLSPPDGGWRAGRYEVACDVSVEHYVHPTTINLKVGFDVLQRVPPRGSGGGAVMTVFVVLGLLVAALIWWQEEGPEDRG